MQPRTLEVITPQTKTFSLPLPFSSDAVQAKRTVPVVHNQRTLHRDSIL
jgi:hypothetical protein